MSYFRPLLGVSAAALIVSASAAFADVTAADVWAQWKDYFGRSGQTLTTGSENQAGDTLTVTDLAISADTPETTYTVKMDKVTFKENGDGSVDVTLPASYPVVLDIHPQDGTASKATLDVDQSGLKITASGTPDAIGYDFAGDSLALSLASFESPDAADAKADGKLTLNGVKGTYQFGAGDPQPFTSSLDATSVDLMLDITASSADGGGRTKVSGTVADLKSQSTGAMPNGVDYADMTKSVAAGFAVQGGITYGKADYDVESQNNPDSFTAKVGMGSGGADFGISSDGLNYATNGTDMDVTVTGSSIPVPQLTMKMAQSAFGLKMPIVKSDTPQDVAALVKMIDFTVGDEIWGMIDPGGGLPHDPATLILDVKGTANWLVNIMSSDAESGMADAKTPIEIQALNVDQLQLKAVGADLTGTGAFTFDNTDTTTYGGMPAPQGKLDLKLVGGNGLIDKLVTMGMLPQQQAMGAKMMLGMFAKPGDGPDTMTSTIEVKKDGSILANGQQIR